MYNTGAPNQEAAYSPYRLLTLQGSIPTVAGQWERDCTSSSLRLVIRGPRQRRHVSRMHKPTCGLELHYICVYVQKEKVKKQLKDKKLLPKGDERVTIYFQNNTHSFWPSSQIVGKPYIEPPLGVLVLGTSIPTGHRAKAAGSIQRPNPARLCLTCMRIQEDWATNRRKIPSP